MSEQSSEVSLSHQHPSWCRASFKSYCVLNPHMLPPHVPFGKALAALEVKPPHVRTKKEIFFNLEHNCRLNGSNLEDDDVADVASKLLASRPCAYVCCSHPLAATHPCLLTSILSLSLSVSPPPPFRPCVRC